MKVARFAGEEKWTEYKAGSMHQIAKLHALSRDKKGVFQIECMDTLELERYSIVVEVDLVARVFVDR